MQKYNSMTSIPCHEGLESRKLSELIRNVNLKYLRNGYATYAHPKRNNRQNPIRTEYQVQALKRKLPCGIRMGFLARLKENPISLSETFFSRIDETGTGRTNAKTKFPRDKWLKGLSKNQRLIFQQGIFRVKISHLLEKEKTNEKTRYPFHGLVRWATVAQSPNEPVSSIQFSFTPSSS